MNVNIGGGDGWDYPGWRNFDQREGFRFDAKTVFPIADRSAEFVYSSHCLEHLDDATVGRVLAEARRMCRGKLVLKLPDFEEVLRRWRADDKDYFNHWGQGKVIPTWKSQGVQDTIDARAAMIFCGWWNDEYGDEWGRRNPSAPKAYHGPVTNFDYAAALHNAREWFGPNWLADGMKKKVPKGGHLNHQNAWSRAELGDLLKSHGFLVEHMDGVRACQLPIPTIEEQRGISMYAVAS